MDTATANDGSVYPVNFSPELDGAPDTTATVQLSSLTLDHDSVVLYNDASGQWWFDTTKAPGTETSDVYNVGGTVTVDFSDGTSQQCTVQLQVSVGGESDHTYAVRLSLGAPVATPLASRPGQSGPPSSVGKPTPSVPNPSSGPAKPSFG